MRICISFSGRMRLGRRTLAFFKMNLLHGFQQTSTHKDIYIMILIRTTIALSKGYYQQYYVMGISVELVCSTIPFDDDDFLLLGSKARRRRPRVEFLCSIPKVVPRFGRRSHVGQMIRVSVQTPGFVMRVQGPDRSLTLSRKSKDGTGSRGGNLLQGSLCQGLGQGDATSRMGDSHQDLSGLVREALMQTVDRLLTPGKKLGPGFRQGWNKKGVIVHIQTRKVMLSFRQCWKVLVPGSTVPIPFENGILGQYRQGGGGGCLGECRHGVQGLIGRLQTSKKGRRHPHNILQLFFYQPLVQKFAHLLGLLMSQGR